MGLFDKRKKKKFYEGKLYLIQVNLENNYRNEVIQMSKEAYTSLQSDLNSGEIDDDMFNELLRKINNYVNKADSRFYPIEKNL